MLHEFNLPADKEKINSKENSTDSILDIILLLPVIITYTQMYITTERYKVKRIYRNLCYILSSNASKL